MQLVSTTLLLTLHSSIKKGMHISSIREVQSQIHGTAATLARSAAAAATTAATTATTAATAAATAATTAAPAAAPAGEATAERIFKRYLILNCTTFVDVNEMTKLHIQ